MTSFQIDNLDSIYAQTTLTPCIGYLWNSGHSWHLNDGCPEVERLAMLGKDDLRGLYEGFRAEVASGSISQVDANLLHLLFGAVALRLVVRGSRQQSPSWRIFNTMDDWCRDRYFGHAGPHVPQSTGSTGQDWFNERG